MPGRVVDPATAAGAGVHDLDTAQRAISEFFLPVQLRQRGEATLSMRLDRIASGRVTLGRVRFGSRVQVVTGPAVNYHVNIPLAGRARSSSGRDRDVLISPGTAAVFLPGAEAEVRWADDTEQLCLMIDPADLRTELSRLLGHEAPDRPEFAARMDLTTSGGRSWLAVLRLLESEAAAGGPLLQHRLAAHRLEQLVIDGFLLAHADRVDQPSAASGAVSHRAAHRAVELLRQRPEHPWTIAELAAAVAVSSRSLHSAFREITATTPMAYLQQRRLEHAHDDLVAAPPGSTTVADVAYSWGFVHWGRFAAAYRRRYGESPAQTLRRPV